MVSIPEYKRDESRDYLFVLKSLNEIPFPVGKKLLIDFLKGEGANKSIEKNKLYDLSNFGILDFLEEDKIDSMIDELIKRGFVDLSGSVFNKYMKVLSISRTGQNELINPSLGENKISGKIDEEETKITDFDLEAFRELENFLRGYNMEQKKAIISSKKKILCIAGAGSGKTTVLTKRIEFLNKMKRIKGDKILAITFTRRAKEEMKKRLEKLEVYNVVVETFNSFCEKILLKNGGRVYGKKVRVASYQDKMFALLGALENLDLDIEKAIDKYFTLNQKRNKTGYQLQNLFLNDCFSVLEFYKLTGKNMNFFSENLDGRDLENAKMIFGIVKFLNSYLLNHGLRTYADQLNDCVNFFKMQKKYIPLFEHVLVDEFQDVNSIQVELIKLLDSKNLFCVGDPRQSIFGWRGSDINHILNFRQEYLDSDLIYLKRNYRSNSHVVNLMNKSIKDMRMPDLEHSFEGKKFLEMNSFSNEGEEFEFVAEEILKSNDLREEIFVLARTNRQLNDLSSYFKKKGIKHILKNEGNPDLDLKKDFVTLSTIHSIKGLEAETVFVIGANSINFPCKSSEHPVMEIVKMYEYDKIEEEKRLFYVAISRAKNNLYLTYTGKKPTYFISNEMLEVFD